MLRRACFVFILVAAYMVSAAAQNSRGSQVDVDPSVIMEVAQKNDVAKLGELVQSGVDLNVRESHGGRTALMVGVDFRHAPIAEALIKAGADVNIKDKEGRTALVHAISTGNSELLQILVAAGADVNLADENRTSPLMHAAWECRADVVHKLQHSGAKLGVGDWKMRRPPLFEDFPVQKTFTGTSARLDMESNPQAGTYRTRLRAAAKGKPNFAGHYVLTSWGCGSSCQSYMLIDTISGKVFDGFGAERGADFRITSSLVIADPAAPGAVAYADDPVPTLPVRYLEWDGSRFRLLDMESCSVNNYSQKCGCEGIRESVLQGKSK